MIYDGHIFSFERVSLFRERNHHMDIQKYPTEIYRGSSFKVARWSSQPRESRAEQSDPFGEVFQ